MKKILTFIFLSLLFQPILICQEFFIQVEQYQGVSYFIPSHSHFKTKYSYQYGGVFGISGLARLDASIGIAYQKAGAAGYIWEINSFEGASRDVRQTLNVSFLKFPIDLTIKIGKLNAFSIGLGVYYSISMASNYGTNSPFGTIQSPILLEELDQNDYGLRFKPSINVPLHENYSIQMGVLQEVGLHVFGWDLTHFNTNIFLAIKYRF